MFDSQISALIWAFPVVLLIGLGAVLLLKRFLPAWAQPQRPQEEHLRRVGDPLVLSPETTLHCVCVEGRLFIVTESDRAVVLTSVEPSLQATARKTWGPWKQK